jgi:hypothetical protein
LVDGASFFYAAAYNQHVYASASANDWEPTQAT